VIINFTIDDNTRDEKNIVCEGVLASVNSVNSVKKNNMANLLKID